MNRLKLTLQYHGGFFGGWQFQPSQGAPSKPSIQGLVAQAVSQLWGGESVHPSRIIAAGRTDAGVHATAQVCHLEDPRDLESIRYLDGLNHFLPPEIRVTRVSWVDEHFHARHSATERQYIYKIVNTRILSPHQRGLVGHVIHPLNINTIQEAIHLIPLGESDFSSFRDTECQSRTPICNLKEFCLQKGEENITFHITADHFLHHMVRNIVGTLVEFGLGRRHPQDIVSLLAAKDRKYAGPTFSPAGLYLKKIGYLPHIEKNVVE